MAILENVEGIKVSIESNGQILTEYADDEDWTAPPPIVLTPGMHSSTYVECISDAEFKIKFEVSSGFTFSATDHVTFWASVDGKKIGWKGQPRTGLRGGCGSGFIGALERISPTQVVERPLKFCSIKQVDVADSERVKKDVKLAAGVGEIHVFVYRTTCVVKELTTYSFPGFKDVTPPSEIAEKAMKGRALSHGIGFGAGTTQDLSHYELTYPDGGEERPLGAFRFKYRSRVALQSELIIPRSPSPDGVIDPPHRQMDVNIPGSRQERLRKLKEEIAKIKAEGEESSSGSGKRPPNASQVPSSERAHKTRRKAGGRIVVDLTDD